MKILSVVGSDTWPLPDARTWGLLTTAASNDIRKRVIRQWSLWPGFTASEERWFHYSDPRPVNITCVYNAQKQYVGDVKFARYLISEGISPELSSPQHSVCSIGFCAREKKWAGWSHRAMCKFGIGDRIFEEDYGNDQTLFKDHGARVIETLEHAREAAVAFADYIG